MSDYRDTQVAFVCGCDINHTFKKGMVMNFCGTHEFKILAVMKATTIYGKEVKRI